MKLNHTTNKKNFIRTDIHTNVALENMDKRKLRRLNTTWKTNKENPLICPTILTFKGSGNKFQAIIDYIDSLENN